MLRRAILLDLWGPKPEVGKNARMKGKKMKITSLIFFFFFSGILLPREANKWSGS